MLFTSIDPLRDLATSTRTFDYDVVRSDDGVTVHVDIPGIDPADVDLTVDGRSLRVDAPRPNVDASEDVSITNRRRQSPSTQTFQLGTQLDADNLIADYAFGVLTISIPVAESAKPRKISVGLSPTLTEHSEAA